MPEPRADDRGRERANAGVLRRLAAFTTDPAGDNPAGVWIRSEEHTSELQSH